MDQVLQVIRSERVDMRAEIDRQVKLATAQIEARATMELDAAMAARGQGQGASAQSTPLGPSSAQMRARATPIVRQELAIIVEEDDEDKEADEEDDEVAEGTFGRDVETGGQGPQAVAAASAKALTKRDPHPQPASFWHDRIPPPESMGEIAGGEFKFGGN
jgi:hypothetical protein